MTHAPLRTLQKEGLPLLLVIFPLQSISKLRPGCATCVSLEAKSVTADLLSETVRVSGDPAQGQRACRDSPLGEYAS